MKNYFTFLSLSLIVVLFISCSTNIDDADNKQVRYNGTNLFISKLLGEISASSKLRSSNEVTENSEDNIITEDYLIENSKIYLAENDIDYTEFFEDPTDPRISILAMGIAEYDIIYLSEASTETPGTCVLQALGVKGLTNLGIKAIAKKIGKAIVKKAIPYVGWGLFSVELAYCLYQLAEMKTEYELTKGVN